MASMNLNIPPENLHRYFNFEGGLNFLETGKLRLSSVFSFNDPFEFLVRTDYPMFFLSLRENTTLEEINNRVELLAQENLLTIKHIVKKKADCYVKRMKMFRIGCFSEVDDSLLMWSHYAESHKGILITFNTAMEHWDNNFHKVIYDSNRVGMSADAFEKKFYASSKQRRLLIQKASCWSYEKEWRYIGRTVNCENGNFLTIDPKAVVRIVIGCKVSDENLKKLKEVIHKKWSDPSIEIYRVEPDRHSYSLKKRDITNLIKGNDLVMPSNDSI